MEETQFFARLPAQLNPQQQAAVRAGEGPVLLLAVPGSGKTTVLVARIGYLCYVRGVAPQRILTMTYTVSAARDMRSRFARFFGQEAAQLLEFRTINGVCSRIIRYYEQVFGRTAFRLLEDGGEKAALLGELYRAQTREFAPDGTIKSLETALTYVKNQMLSGEELDQVEVEGVDFPAFYHSYVQTLRQRGRMDYDDQMVYALQILRKFPRVLEAVQDQYQYFCVDEAQDTSKIQHCIIRLLASRSGNLFLVGDEDQSIYSFRAAYPQALTGFEGDYPGAQVLYLEQNYRSTPQIVAAADQFIQKNTPRHPKHMKAVREDGPAVREIPVLDRRAQYRYLCQVARDCTVPTAVLYRDNDSALPLIDLLERQGIPYASRQVDSTFFSNRVVRDLTDLIRFAQDPWDGELFLRLYYKLGAGISKSLAQQAAAQAAGRGETILQLLAKSGAASPWTRKQCKALQTHLDNLLEERGDRAVYRMVHFMGYGAYLEERGGDLRKAEILEALGSETETPADLLERLEELRGVVQAGSAAPDCPFVLSTIHSSKGLEYQRVFLMDVARGLLPKTQPEEDADLYQEERRLFYVAMTRAQDELALFTFRKVGLTSPFSREIFPQKATADGPKKKNLSIPVRPAPGQGEADAFTPGTRVRHTVFGPGLLTGRTGDIVSITFDQGTDKRLSLSAALRAGSLKTE